MSKKNPSEVPGVRCPVICKPDTRTLTSNGRTVPDSAGQPNLRMLATNVLGEGLSGHLPDSAGQCVSGEENTAGQFLAAFFDSLKPLEAQSVSIAVLDDGTMRVVQTDAEVADALERGFTIYSPQDMYYFVQLEPHERRMLHDFKRRFGGTVKRK